MWVFFFYEYGKFWSILGGQKVERKPLFFEVCIDNQDRSYQQNLQNENLQKNHKLVEELLPFFALFSLFCPTM